MKAKHKGKKWRINETTKYFLSLILIDEKKEERSEIIKFRLRWKLGKEGLPNERYFPEWQKKVERECQGYCHEIKVSEIEVYFNPDEKISSEPIFSSLMENRVREFDFGRNLTSLFVLEIRALGKKLRIPSEYDSYLEYFLIYDKENVHMIFNHGITTSVRFRFSEEYGELSENVCLTLGENTVSDDLDIFWETQLKPFLTSLSGRINDVKRIGRTTRLLKKMKKNKPKDGGWSSFYRDDATDKKIRTGDREIILDTLSDKQLDRLYSVNSPEKEKELNKKINKTLGRKVYNERYYRYKRKSLH